jgi:hypothetical protein
MRATASGERRSSETSGGRHDAELSDFHCSIEWHLARLGSWARILYPFAYRLAHGDGGCFYASGLKVARHLGCSPDTVYRACQELVSDGFFRLVRTGRAGGRWKRTGKPVQYEVVSHQRWAQLHPGECAEKISFPWTGQFDPERDALGAEIYKASGIKFERKELNYIRACGRSEVEIVRELQFLISEGQTDKKHKLLSLLLNRLKGLPDEASAADRHQRR